MVVMSSGVAVRGADKAKGSLDKLKMRKVIEDAELSPLLFGNRAAVAATAPLKQIQNHHVVSAGKCIEGSGPENGYHGDRRFDNTTFGYVPQFSLSLPCWDDDGEYTNSATKHFHKSRAQNDFRAQTNIPKGSSQISAQPNYAATEDQPLQMWDFITEDTPTMSNGMDDRHSTLTTIVEEDSVIGVDKWNGRGHKVDRGINPRSQQQYNTNQADRRHSRYFVENPNFDYYSNYSFEDNSQFRIKSPDNSATYSPSISRPGERQDTGNRRPRDEESAGCQADSRFMGVSPSTHIPGKNWENYSDFLGKDCDIPVHNLDPAGCRKFSNTGIDNVPKMDINRQIIVGESSSSSKKNRLDTTRRYGRAGMAASASEVSLNHLGQQDQTVAHQTGNDQDVRQLRSCDRPVPCLEKLLESNSMSRTRQVMSSMPDLRSYDPQSVSTSQKLGVRGHGSKQLYFRDQKSDQFDFPDQRSDQFDFRDQRSDQFDFRDQRSNQFDFPDQRSDQCDFRDSMSDQFDFRDQRSDQFDFRDQRSDQFDFRDQKSNQFDFREQKSKQFNVRGQRSEISHIKDQRPELFDNRENPSPYYRYSYQQPQTGPHAQPSPATHQDLNHIRNNYLYNCPLNMADHNHNTAPWEIVSDIPSSPHQIYPPTQHHFNAAPMPDPVQPEGQPYSSYDQLHLNECNKLKHMRTDSSSLDLWNLPQLQRQIRATSEMCLQASRRHMFASSADIHKLFSGQTKWTAPMLPSEPDSSSSGMRNTPDGQSAFKQKYQSLETPHPFQDSPRPTMRHQMMNLSQHSVRGMKQSLSVDHIASIQPETRINSTNIPSASISDLSRSIFEGHRQMLSTRHDADRSSFHPQHPTTRTYPELDSSVFHRHQLSPVSKDLSIPVYQRQQTVPAHHTHKGYTPDKHNQSASVYLDMDRSGNHGQYRAGIPNLDFDKSFQRRGSLCDDLGLGRIQLQHQSSGYSSETELQQIESNAYSNNHPQEMQTYKKFIHSPSEGLVTTNSSGDSSANNFEDSKEMAFVYSNQSSLTKASTAEISNMYFDQLVKEHSVAKSSTSSGTSSCTPSETQESRELTSARSPEIFLPPRSFSGNSGIVSLNCITQSDSRTTCQNLEAIQSQGVKLNDRPATTIHMFIANTPTSHIPTSHTATSHIPTSYTATSHIPTNHTATSHKPLFHKSIDHLPTSHILQSYQPTFHTSTFQTPTFQTPTSHLPADHISTSQISTNRTPTCSTPTSSTPTNIATVHTAASHTAASHTAASHTAASHTAASHILKYHIPLSHIPTSHKHTNCIPTSQEDTTSLPTSQGHTSRIPTSHSLTSHKPTNQIPRSHTPASHIPTSQTHTNHIPESYTPTNDISTSKEQRSHIPILHIPTNNIPTNTIPTNNIPTNNIPTNNIPTNNIPTNNIPTNNIPTNNILTNNLPTDITPTSHIPISHTYTNHIPTSDIHTNQIPTQLTPASHMPLSHTRRSHTSLSHIPPSHMYTHQPPTYQPHTHQPPTYQPHTHQPPTHQPYTHQPPTYHPPTYHPPTHQPHAHQPPTYQPSTHHPPTHQPPTYQPSTHHPPTHQPPTYQPPTNPHNNPQHTNTTSHPNLTINNSPTSIMHNKSIPTHPMKHSASLLELSSASSRHEHFYSRAMGSQTGGAFQRDSQPRLQGNRHGLQLRYNSSGSLHLSAFGAAHKSAVPFETSIVSDELGDRLSTLV